MGPLISTPVLFHRSQDLGRAAVKPRVTVALALTACPMRCDALVELVTRLDIPPTCIGPLLETLKKASALEQANLPPHA